MLDEIQIEVTKTANGQAEYVQIRSPAAIPVNIVLVATKIIVSDKRPTADDEPPKRKAKVKE